jgi:hypothetical protein
LQEFRAGPYSQYRHPDFERDKASLLHCVQAFGLSAKALEPIISLVRRDVSLWDGFTQAFGTGAVALIVQRALADARPAVAEIEPVAAGSLVPVLSVCSRPLRFAS